MAAKSPSSQVTLRDVAKISGVSFQTVSRVVNNSPGVSIKTRRRVLEAVEALGYYPNLTARSLKTGQSLILEVIAFGVDTYVPRELMEAIGRAAKARGYRVMYSSIPGDDLQEVQRLLHRLQSRACDGTLITSPVENAAIAMFMDTQVPIPILQLRNKPGSTLPSVIIDQVAGTRMAVQHLIDLGHREIAEISGPLNWHEAALRHESYLATLAANGLTSPVVIEGTEWMPQSGYEAAHRLLDSGRQFSALVTGNDYLALGAILALTDRGIRVPEDVSIVGFDDTPEAAFFRPPLTTINQDYEAMGQQSVQYLIDLIENPDTYIHQRVLMPRLIERRSVQPFGSS
jgi:DNA-binding LacI/PurR family transcriptional regulator